ncbi:MAG: translation initiation factor IF-2, partial [Pseudomonadota bacterium]
RQRQEAEEAARVEAEDQARKEQEEQARREAEEQARQAEEQRLAEEKVRKEEEERAHKFAEEERKRKQQQDKKPATRYGRKELHVAGGAAGRRRKPTRRVSSGSSRPSEHGFSRPTAPVVREIEVPDTISVADLAKLMAVKAGEVIKVLMGMGTMVTINQVLDQDTAILVVEEMGHSAKAAADKDIETELLVDESEDQGDAVTRPPVVTVMGHVDHGKTSLLDYIRESRVAAGEAGGITQHIGAYHVDTDKGGITFLDTPGHAAFTAMRARGAQATDIVILVVAADDGVMPQTEEAIQHARAAEVPLIVAVNKMDKPEADIERVKGELAAKEVVPDDWGGEEQFIPVSAATGDGVDDLIEAIGLQAELLELTAVEDRNARGIVIESSLDKGRGPLATVLVQEGTLKHGDMMLAGQEIGRVRAMFDDGGSKATEVGPSMPVQVLGLSGVPMAGDEVLVAANERKAREAASKRQEREREGRLAEKQAANLQNLFDSMGKDEQLQVNLLVRADVQGSVEALRDALVKLSNDDVKVNIIASGVGAITESDASLAQASGAIIIGFNVRADATARKSIQENDLDLRYYSVIYDAIDEVKAAISGMLGTETKESIIGLAEVKDVFRSSSHGPIAGCLVIEGVVRRDNPIRVLRDNVVIFEGELESLRRFKDDVKEVQSGTECGIGVKHYNHVKPGDPIECFERIEVARTL